MVLVEPEQLKLGKCVVWRATPFLDCDVKQVSSTCIEITRIDHRLKDTSAKSTQIALFSPFSHYCHVNGPALGVGMGQWQLRLTFVNPTIADKIKAAIEKHRKEVMNLLHSKIKG